MRRFFALTALVLSLSSLPAFSADMLDLLGTFKGSATITHKDAEEERDMSVTVSPTDKGFQVEWTSVIYKADGRTKSSGYKIQFLTTQRDGIFCLCYES